MATGERRVDWLERTAFDTWRWPGLFLLAVIAVPMATAAVLEIVRSRWAFAASMVAAAAQVAWIVVQLGVLRRYFFLPPVLLGAGCSWLRWRFGHTGARRLSAG